MNADDLGYTAGINRAILTLHAAGALSSSTAMATGDALPAISPAATGSLGIGCHVVLVDGRPAAPLGAVSSLLASPAGTAAAATVPGFRPGLGRFVADLLRGRILDSEIEREAVAQIRSMQDRGFRVTHVDTHKHTHLFGRVLRPLLRAALQCGVTAVRNPYEPAWARSATPAAPRLRRLQVSALSCGGAGFLREVERSGMRTTAGALGVLATGSLETPALQTLLTALRHHGIPGAAYELVCHPGFDDAELAAQPTRLRAERVAEHTALLAAIPAWVAAVPSHRLVTFADL